jgi:hypothetical protein
MDSQPEVAVAVSLVSDIVMSKKRYDELGELKALFRVVDGHFGSGQPVRYAKIHSVFI